MEISRTPLDEFLHWYVPRVERACARFLRAQWSSAARVSADVQDYVRALGEYVRGGKKLRGALVQIGYECAGGPRRFLPASLAYEFLHSLLLAHDDIIDRAVLRRGRPTLHAQFSAAWRSRAGEKGATRFGTAVALTLGDLACFWGLELVGATPVPPLRHQRVIRELGRLLAVTVEGQLLEMHVDWRSRQAASLVWKIAERKTAHYTITGPLVVGALLGGASPRLLQALGVFGKPVGIAFQLRDDILGLYGEEAHTGKSPLSDLREGKPTLLIVRAYRRGTRWERRILEKFWGNPRAGERGLRAVRDIVQSTGARRDVERGMHRLISRGMHAIPLITRKAELRTVLASVASAAALRPH